jgi:hypothetical protein
MPHIKNSNPQQELENFSWQWNNVQPINPCISNAQLIKKNQILTELIAAGAEIINQLSIFHVKIMHGLEHAVLKLECTKCDNGKPAIIYFGIYPSLPNYCPYFSYECNDVNWVKDYKYQLSLEKPSSYNYLQSRNISFPITQQAASHVLDHLDEINSNSLNKYHYNKISNNCLDFAQAIYAESGLEGVYTDHLYNDTTILQQIMFSDQGWRSLISFVEPALYLLEGS